MRLGLIADTHGVLRPAVHELFAGVDHILHAGDVGGSQGAGEAILDELALLAPVTAVYGNVDGGGLRRRLPRVARLEVDGFQIVLTHGDQLDLREPEALKTAYLDADVIVFGHTHRSLIYSLPDYTLVINPGAAGAPRFDAKPSVAIMETEAGIPPRARIVPIS